MNLLIWNWGALEQGTDPPTAPRKPQHKWLLTAPGVFTEGVCSLLGVCTLDGLVVVRAQIPSMFLAVCHVTYMHNLLS